MAEDPELKAMAAIKGALEGLDEATRGHVLRWAAQRFDVELPGVGDGQPGPDATAGDRGDRTPPPKPEAGAYEDAADIVSAAGAETDDERVLVLSYWFQVIKGQPNVTSQPVNTELKNLGHPIARMNDVVARLVATRPQLVMQVKKRGTKQQARKVFKLTKQGTDRVEAMIAGTFQRES